MLRFSHKNNKNNNKYFTNQRPSQPNQSYNIVASSTSQFRSSWFFVFIVVVVCASYFFLVSSRFQSETVIKRRMGVKELFKLLEHRTSSCDDNLLSRQIKKYSSIVLSASMRYLQNALIASCDTTIGVVSAKFILHNWGNSRDGRKINVIRP